MIPSLSIRPAQQQDDREGEGEGGRKPQKYKFNFGHKAVGLEIPAALIPFGGGNVITTYAYTEIDGERKGRNGPRPGKSQAFLTYHLTTSPAKKRLWMS